MGLFSSPPPPLRNDVKAAITPFLFADDVREKTRADSQSKIAKSQETLLGALNANEKLAVIVPVYDGGYAGLVVATTERLLELKGKRIAKQFSLSSLAAVERMTSPHGTFLLALISDEALPFAKFALGEGRNRSTQLYWAGTIQAPILTKAMMDHFVQATGYSE